MQEQRLLILLSCLVPLAALAATVVLDTPVLPTVLVALLALLPLAYGLLRTHPLP